MPKAESNSLKPRVKARNESFRDSLEYQVFPKLKCMSIVILLTLINWGLFIACLMVGGIDNSSLLSVPTPTLVQFGAKVPDKIRYDYEVWRLITACFLHSDLSHIFGNSLTLLLIGQMIEYEIGWFRFLALYLLSGFGGTLFSACMS